MTRAREAARLIGNNTFRLDSNNAVGFNSTTPDAMFDINHGLTVAGVSTFTGNVIMSGDLTVQGTTTTLDTIVQEVDLMNIQANSSTPGLGVTQTGSGDIAKFYDGTSAVFTIADGGNVTVNSGTLTLNNNLDLQDNDQILLGSSDDLKIYHDGSNSYIDESGTGQLTIRSSRTSIQKYTGEICGTFTADGAVELYYDNSKKFNTSTSGAQITGDLFMDDNHKVRLGTSQDLEIYHDGTNSLLHNDTGSVIIENDASNSSAIFIKAKSGEHSIIANHNGGVELYYDNAKKFETISTGVDVTGTLNASGIITAEAGAVAEIGTLTDASTVTPDFATHCNFTLTFTSGVGNSRTVANPSNLVAGQSGSIFLVQDTTGSRTVTWGSYWDWAGGTAPTLSTAGSSVDRVDYIVRSSTSIHAVATLAYS